MRSILPADSVRLGRFVTGWSIAYPLLLIVSFAAGTWLLALHYYTLPLVFFAHFLMALGGAALVFGWRRTGRWLAGAGAVLAIACAVVALTLVWGLGDPADEGALTVYGVRALLYLTELVYLGINVLVVRAVVRGWPPEGAPAA